MPVLLQINAALNCGSTGRIAENIGLLARADGWDVHIAHGTRYVNPSALSSFQISSLFGERWAALRSRLSDRHGLSSVRATKRLIAYIKEIEPDIIHLHNIHGYYLNYKLLFEYLQQTKIPVVWTLHDCWAFTGHCVYFDRINCNRWQSGCYGCPQLQAYPIALKDHSFENYSLKKKLFTSLGDRLTLVPVSDWLAGLLRYSFFANTKIQTIHNGIDVGIFAPSKTKDIRDRFHLNGKFLILGVATGWGERKGYFDYLKLRNLLPENYLIMMIGLTQKQIEQLPSGIIGISQTQNQAELADFYSMADVFVNPTYEDNYPTVNLEAMASGTPVVTYRTGGSPEAVTQKTGLVVDQGNVEQLAEAIQKITSANIYRYTINCRKYAEENFDKQKQFQKYINLYNSLVN